MYLRNGASDFGQIFDPEDICKDYLPVFFFKINRCLEIHLEILHNENEKSLIFQKPCEIEQYWPNFFALRVSGKAFVLFFQKHHCPTIFDGHVLFLHKKQKHIDHRNDAG